MAEMMNGNGMEKKYYVKDDDDYASKGVANTALGLGIGSLALNLLQNGGLANLFNGGSNTGNCGCAYTCQDRLSDMEKQHQELFGVYKNQVDTSFSNYKYTRDMNDTIMAKQNADAFALFQGYTTATAGLQKQIDELKTQNAVLAATRPLQDQLIMNAIALEAERRSCADNKIVNYLNSNFYPISVADVTTGTTTTQRLLSNPLCGCPI
jgi:hypothetical protein